MIAREIESKKGRSELERVGDRQRKSKEVHSCIILSAVFLHLFITLNKILCIELSYLKGLHHIYTSNFLRYPLYTEIQWYLSFFQVSTSAHIPTYKNSAKSRPQTTGYSQPLVSFSNRSLHLATTRCI